MSMVLCVYGFFFFFFLLVFFLLLLLFISLPILSIIESLWEWGTHGDFCSRVSKGRGLGVNLQYYIVLAFFSQILQLFLGSYYFFSQK